LARPGRTRQQPQAKRCAEDVASEVLGVKDVDNRLRIGEVAQN
jgi:osmotically-inducible protein OsmY